MPAFILSANSDGWHLSLRGFDYKFVETPATWYSAKEQCEQMGAILAVADQLAILGDLTNLRLSLSK